MNLTRLGVIGIALILATPDGAHAHTRTQIKDYDLGTSTFTGDQLRGPRTIRANNLNLLRYDYKFSNTVTFSQAVDLWSKLQAAAIPAATPQPASVSPPGARPAARTAVGTAGLNSADRALIDQAEQVIAVADKQFDGASSLIDAANGTLNVPGDCSAPLPSGLDLTKETNRQDNCLAVEASATSNAVALVKAAGQELVVMLQRAWSSPDLTVANIKQELLATSAFMKGINATWWDFTGTETLYKAALGWKGELATRQTQFSNGLPTISGALTAANKALSDIKGTLDAQAKTAPASGRPALTTESSDVQSEIDKLNNQLKELTKVSSLLQWAAGENQSVLAAIPDLRASSQKYTDFQTAQTALISWQTRMGDLTHRWDNYEAAKAAGKTDEKNPNPFSKMSPPATCDFAFSRTKTTAIVLTRTDLMPGTTTTAPETVLSVTVECTSPFTVSAGVAFSTIGSRQFAIEPAAGPPASGTTTPTTVNTFVATNNSSFHPLPIGMIHARVWELNDTIAFHASFGMAGNFQSQSAGGSSAEFLIGPSVSLFRTMFFTPGLHIGTRSTIGAGFSVGDAVPSGVTTVPIQKSYVPAFGVAITFTKP